MDSKELEGLLRSWHSCALAFDVTRGMSWEEYYATSERPDHIIWIFHHMIGQPGWPTQEEIHVALDLCMEAMAVDSSANPNAIVCCKLHLEFYKTNPQQAISPMLLNEEVVSTGYFGNLKVLADILRANLKVKP